MLSKLLLYGHIHLVCIIMTSHQSVLGFFYHFYAILAILTTLLKRNWKEFSHWSNYTKSRLKEEFTNK